MMNELPCKMSSMPGLAQNRVGRYSTQQSIFCGKHQSKKFNRPLYQTGECNFGERKTGAKQSGQMNVLKSISKEICHDPCRTLPLFIPREVDVIVFFSIGSCVLHFTTADVSSWTQRCNNNIQPSPMPV